MSGLMDMLGRRGLAAGAQQDAGTLLTLDDLRAGAPRLTLQAAVRARCHAVTLDQHTVLCRVLGKYKFLVDSRDFGLAPHLMLDGYWEMWCTEFMLRCIRPGQVAWDVGANLGYYAVLMADLVGRQGKVLALEPNPRLALLCERTLALNGYWATATVRRLAASDRAGTLRFRAALSDPKNGRLLPEGAPPPAADEEEDTLEVAVRAMSLDEVAEGPVDFIKIDVEGAEEQVWAGMQRVLDRSPDITVLMEFNALRCRAPEETLRAIADRYRLRELGFDGALHRVGIAEILPRREDTLLVLSRGDP
ncbi:FkbM family methyltransferase [Falsiroseomonas bella]|uniref:FkbM family methyltransferase n=1 Tax=Falsiroseomonas bella TaxID=2184016 RepID=A0A317FFK1_9PROT|nr:FkbM family methyltransferase [Falsiroseomonas bella]PWS37851.1 FkbM family methyltransferase [Falsiroseomonas bella]